MAGSGSAQTFNPNVHSMLELRRALQQIRIQVPIASYDWTGDAPGNDDDINDGWRVGSVIISGGLIYICSDNSSGAAIWQRVGSLGTGVGAPSSVDGGNDTVIVWDDSASANVPVLLSNLIPRETWIPLMEAEEVTF